jgi:hypothetical protein
LHGWTGILIFTLLLVQLLLGLRVIPSQFKFHKVNGIMIVCLAAIHATIALSVWFGLFRVG